MKDEEIIKLYFARNESAIAETERKYDAYLLKVAYNILSDLEDSREKVNDTYFRTWNIIPPNKPLKFSAFLAKITRELSIDLYRKKHSRKRFSGEYELAYDEIGDFISDTKSPEKETEALILSEFINNFIINLSEQQRNIFVCRYFYFDSLSDIAQYYDITVPKVKTTLYRLRQSLKAYLEEEGFSI